MQLRPGEFPLLQQMVQQLAGVVLDSGKGYLIETRLGPLAEKAGCSTFNELYFKIRYGQDGALAQRVIEAITTHETIFFRDGAPYDALQFKLLPEVLDARERSGKPRTIRIWSAACSTGQEPYSIAMVLHELLGDLRGYDVQILATDIARETLATAERGVFADHEVQRSARPQLLAKYLTRTDQGYRVVDSVRRLVTFQPRNLLEPLHGIGPFDIVFLRNVLIYFTAEARRAIVERVSGALLPHGWLVVGGAENLLDLGPRYQPQTHCRATVYQPNLAPAAPR